MDRETPGPAPGDHDWTHEVVGARRDGAVRVRLTRRAPAASVEVEVTPRGTHPRALATTRAGDVTHLAAVGLTAPQAAALTTRFARRLDAAPSTLLADFPHLLLARAAPPPRAWLAAALAHAWPAAPAPRPCADVVLDPAGVGAFLAPEVARDGGPALAGYRLRAVVVTPQRETPPACRLEFEPAPPLSSAPAAPPWSAVLRAGTAAAPGFGATGALGVDPGEDLPPPAARACSLLATLVALKQADGFAPRAPAALTTTAARATATALTPALTPAPPPPDPAAALRFAIEASGYVHVPQAVAADELALLRAAADRAFDAVRRAIAAGVPLAYTFYDPDVYLGTRCLYCWGEACERLVASDVVHGVATAVLGDHKLFDMTAHSALPAAALGPQRTERWHRDIDVVAGAPADPRYLWFMVCLDDFTAENGATWVVPGSQRVPSARNLPDATPGERYPTRVQLVARAGDVLVLNPSALHTVGHNRTARARRMINVSVCRSDVRALLDHWAIAGPAVQRRAGARLRGMLGAARERPLDASWSVLPEGWQTGAAPADPPDGTPGGARVFAEEQRESFQPTALTERGG